MRRLVAVVLALLVSGCPGPGPADAGGGGTGGSSGGGTGGGGGTTGGGGGALADVGTLSGTLAFPVLDLEISGSVLDGGSNVSLMTVLLVDHVLAGPACNPTIAVPLAYVQFTVQMFDGGALTPGTYDFPFDVYGKREALTAGSQETQYITQGSITLTQVGTARSAGTLTATLDHGDGGTSALTGSWNGALCPQ